ncbi:MAG: ribbon-helix-helix domain-containing protein [Clostridiales bacterium]|nr:ribbon-helix-helix domain-containing protein [Clostridiales bacterium]
MAPPRLKTRTRLSTSMQNDIMSAFEAFVKETRIPMTRLLDEAVLDLLIKYDRWNGPPPEPRQWMGMAVRETDTAVR